MSESNLLTVDLSEANESYVVSCWKCGEKFDAMSSAWCSCDAELRTLQCSHCESCFCRAPFVYKVRFWNGAPKALRENARRFHIPTADAVRPDSGPAKMPASGSPRVLIVDDDEPIRSLAACYVEQMGYEATTVSNPEEALLLAAAVSFAVVLTDALMPKMDGRELCRRLKEEHGNQIKVVLMTSLYKARRFRTEAFHVFGADEFLAKPLRYEELRDALKRVAPLAGQAA